MQSSELNKVSRRGITGTEIASRSSDPSFYFGLDVLPNPDPILRKLGKSHEVFDAVAADPHVMGERRSIRSGLLKFEWRVAAGGESAADLKAVELCEAFMNRKPAPGMRWPDVIWNIAEAIFHGMKVHEVVWERQDSLLMPAKILDRENRRFKFNQDNELRILTKEQPLKGIEAEAFRFLLTRHMHSAVNPYGEAIFSSCFWPYTFNHNGFRWFTRFCERFGFPWLFGKYPEGSSNEDIKALNDGLAEMIDAAAGSVPIGSEVEAIQNSVSGQLVHERLIKVCDAQMSKALTSQTLATEIHDTGARAASETHRDREESVNESDREVVADTISELFGWITLVNVPGAESPKFEFFEEDEPRKAAADFLEKAKNIVPVPRKFAYDILQIPLPEQGEDVVEVSATPTQPSTEFTRENGGNIDIPDSELDTSDVAISSMVEAVRKLAEESETLKEFEVALIAAYPSLSEAALTDHLELAMMTGLLQGVDDAGGTT